jgi:hypothetical protein
MPIANPFWTYCSNHPHHNPNRVRIPVGPVFTVNDDNYGRHVCAPSPDTEEVRSGLLDLIRATTGESSRRYPGGYSLIEGAIRQLGEFRELRAVPELDSVRGLLAEPPPDDQPFGPDPRRLIALARQALVEIIPPEAVVPYRNATAVAIAEEFAVGGNPTARPVLADALEEAGCPTWLVLGYLRTPVPPGQPCWVCDLTRGAEPPAG